MTALDADVAIVGGGVAGLSAALVLGRSRRSTVVIDAGEPRNAPSPAVHSFLSRDGVFAVGDGASHVQQVAVAVGQAVRVAIALNNELVLAAGA